MEKSEKPIKSRKPLIISLIVLSLIIIAVIITLCVALTKKDSDKKKTITNLPSSNNQTGVMVNSPVKFDFSNKRVKLNSGYYMPTSGIGTY